DELRADGRDERSQINMPPVRAYSKALEPFRAVNNSVRPFIGHFRLYAGISTNALLDHFLGQSRKRIDHRCEALPACRRHLESCWRVERFGVAATQGKRADILRVKRLPPHRDLWLLPLILGAGRRLVWS